MKNNNSVLRHPLPVARHPLSFWLKATRPWSLPASTMPVVLTAAYLFFLQKTSETAVNWAFLPLVFLAVICYHLGLNMISDLDDFKTGVDNEHSLGYKSPLVKGETNEKSWKKNAMILLLAGTLIGFLLSFWSGFHLLWIGGIGLISGYFYTFFKKYAMGDLLIFVLFGLLSVQGTFYVLTSELSLSAVFLAIPVGFITTGILHANNTRDIAFDSNVGFHSQASVVGFRIAQWEYAGLIFGAYLAVIIMALFTLLPYWSCLVLLTFPMGLKNVKTMFRASPENLEPFMFLDEATAKLQLVFTLSLSLAIFVSSLFL